jgi:hypothetical protein
MAKQIALRIQENIASNIASVRDEIAAACQRVNRHPDSVKLIAVSKKQVAQDIVAAFHEGIIHFGENRLEEAESKIPQVNDLLQPSISDNIIWHMIGHVQSRKAKDIVQHFQVIHSLDSLKLANRYNQFAAEVGKMPDVLLEINISGETSKAGITADQWQHSRQQRQALWDMIEAIRQLSHIRLVGLMTMAPYIAEPEATRPVFAGLRKLRDALANDFPRIDWRELSMGMTNDYPIAIEEGATFIRIGRAIFGERPI